MKAIRRFMCIVFCSILSLFCLPCAIAHADDIMTAEAEIPVSCLSTDDPEGHIYQIMIEPVNADSPYPRSDTLQISESGNGKFQIDITEPGTYSYIIYEKAGADDKVSYDSNIYHVTLTVENIGQDKLAYAVTAYRNDETDKAHRLEFRDVVMSDEVTTTVTVSTTSAVTTAASTAVTSAAVTSAKNSGGLSAVYENIGSIMTGDSTPVKLFITLIGTAAAVGGAMLLLKKKDNEG